MGFFNKLFGGKGSSKHNLGRQAHNDQANGEAGNSTPSMGAGPLDHGLQQAHAAHSPQRGAAGEGAASPTRPPGHYSRVVDAGGIAAVGDRRQQLGEGGGYLPLPPPTAAPIMAAPAPAPASVPHRYAGDPEPNFVPPGLHGYKLGGQTPPFMPNAPSLHDDVPQAVAPPLLPPQHADTVPAAAAAGYTVLSVQLPANPKPNLASSSSSFMSRVEEVPSTVVCNRGEMDAKSPWIHEVGTRAHPYMNASFIHR